ncbi:MAG TPA: hypothetical protein VLA34_14150, partial [Candidatus Krumholzibacterium sp.]|nr:hypothetical protein [Candidatus Krumholzibacterium sp.]
KETDPFVRGDLLYRKFAFLWEEDREAALSLAGDIESGPETDYRLHLYLCYYLMGEEGQSELAERLFTKLMGLTDDPYKSAHARSVYGEFLIASGRKEEAIKVLEQAGTYPFANEVLASHYWETGEREKAIEAYIHYVSGAPGAREHVNVDSLYAVVYPDRDDLDARIEAAMIIDEGVIPDAGFSDLRGKTHTLSGYRGTILVVTAWSPT